MSSLSSLSASAPPEMWFSIELPVSKARAETGTQSPTSSEKSGDSPSPVIGSPRTPGEERRRSMWGTLRRSSLNKDGENGRRLARKLSLAAQLTENSSPEVTRAGRAQSLSARGSVEGGGAAAPALDSPGQHRPSRERKHTDGSSYANPSEYAASMLVQNASVLDMLRSTKNFDELMQYAVRTFNSDLVCFWLLVDALNRCEGDVRQRLARHIVETYVRSGAVHEVNISATLRCETLAAFDEVDGVVGAALFRGVREEVETLMDVNLSAFMQTRRDSWKRQIKWQAVACDKRDTLAGREANPETNRRLAAWLAGGDASLERRLREDSEVLNSGDIDRVVSIIATYEADREPDK